MKKIILFIFILSACADLGNNYGSPYGGYNDPYYNDYNRGGYGSYGSHDRRDHDRYERERIDRERQRLEDERRRLEEERERQRHEFDNNQRCPSGFSPSEIKCSSEERRRGCKDMRLPNGMGCVRR